MFALVHQFDGVKLLLIFADCQSFQRFASNIDHKRVAALWLGHIDYGDFCASWCQLQIAKRFFLAVDIGAFVAHMGHGNRHLHEAVGIQCETESLHRADILFRASRQHCAFDNLTFEVIALHNQ